LAPEVLEDRRVLITLKNVSIPAESEIPLRAGEKIQVRVERLEPRIVLGIVREAAQDAALISDYVRLFRSNPKALPDMIAGILAEFERPGRGLPAFLAGEDRKNLLGILKSILFSKESLDDSLFLKRYIENIGLLWESGLAKAVQEGVLNAKKNSLKGLLMKIASELQPGPEKEESPGSGPAKSMAELARFSDAFVKTIESHQIINVLSQEYDGRFVFQIPLLLHSGLGTAEIYVDVDQPGEKGEKPDGFHVLMLLDMDALGDISVEAGIIGKKLNCAIQCSDRRVCDFISSSLGILTDRLFALGYRVDSMKCSVEKNILKAGEGLIMGPVLRDTDAVNIFV
ncbi:MAG: hypothetical protein ACE14T_11550, partial [Syntrophales bacterium]